MPKILIAPLASGADLAQAEQSRKIGKGNNSSIAVVSERPTAVCLIEWIFVDRSQLFRGSPPDTISKGGQAKGQKQCL